MRILLVDDEPSYREQIGYVLSEKGHEVGTAASGREAIDSGIASEPDLLIVDWLLKDQIHGLHVAGVLEPLYDEMKVVMITGFGSPELKARAAESGLLLLEKPFDFTALEEAVEKAMCEPRKGRKLEMPLMKVAENLDIIYLNRAARDALGGASPDTLRDLFGGATENVLSAGRGGWFSIRETGRSVDSWKVRVTGGNGSPYVVVLLPPDRQDYFYEQHPVVKMLFEPHDAASSTWPFAGRALVVDDEEIIRSFVSTMFEYVGCICHTAENHQQALQLYERDPGIRFVILDYEMPEGDPAKLIDEMRRIRDAVIVGNSGGDRRTAFAKAGVEHFLAKPWRIEDLIGLLAEAAKPYEGPNNPTLSSPYRLASG